MWPEITSLTSQAASQNRICIYNNIFYAKQKRGFVSDFFYYKILKDLHKQTWKKTAIKARNALG